MNIMNNIYAAPMLTYYVYSDPLSLFYFMHAFKMSDTD